MAKKQPGVDLIKYLPIAVVAVSFISGFTMLKAQAANHDEKIKAIEVVQAKLSADSSDIKISQAEQKAQLTAIYEAVKDLKKK